MQSISSPLSPVVREPPRTLPLLSTSQVDAVGARTTAVTLAGLSLSAPFAVQVMMERGRLLLGCRSCVELGFPGAETAGSELDLSHPGSSGWNLREGARLLFSMAKSLWPRRRYWRCLWIEKCIQAVIRKLREVDASGGEGVADAFNRSTRFYRPHEAGGHGRVPLDTLSLPRVPSDNFCLA